MEGSCLDKFHFYAKESRPCKPCAEKPLIRANVQTVWYQLASFWIWFYKSDFKNTCWASPKPDIQHKIVPTAYLNRRWISKFLVGEIVLVKSALIHSISHQTGIITSVFECQKQKECFLKISASLWYAFYKPSSNFENHMTVCTGYPAITLQERAGRG